MYYERPSVTARMLDTLKSIPEEYRRGAIELFKTAGLAKEVFATDVNGQCVSVHSPGAQNFCLGGAIVRASGGRFDTDDHFNTFNVWSSDSAVHYSNHEETTKEDVIALLEASLI